MRDPPPPALAALFARLGIVLRGTAVPRSRAFSKIARDHVLCQSLWIDALLSRRRLTPFQAAEIYAGRGERLRLGPYVLVEKIGGPAYVGNYRARHVETGALVRLALEKGVRTVFRKLPGADHSCPSAPVENSTDPFFDDVYLQCGREGEQTYFAAPWRDGQSAAEMLVRHGRFPPGVVLEIARGMAGQLADWERQGRCHGDVSTQTLWLSRSGEIGLLWPALRGLLRGGEGFSRADLAPEAYDALAPERISGGGPPTIASDLYACGCVWWHLLGGRPPLPGGDVLSKLCAAQTAAIPDVRRYVSGVPDFFAEALSDCLQAVPERRPASMARLAERLGPPTPAGNVLLRAFFRRSVRPLRRRRRRAKLPSSWPGWLAGLAVAASLLILVVGYRRRTPVLESVAGGRGVVNSVESRDQRSRKNVVKSPAFPMSPTPPRPLAAAIHEGKGKKMSSKTDSRDDQVNRTSFVTFDQRPTTDDQPPPDVLLTPENVTPGMQFHLEPGQRMIGRSGRRVCLSAGQPGVTITGENVLIENVDFTAGAGEASALVVLHSRRAGFRGCTFQGCKTAAVRWTNPSEDDAAADQSPKLSFTNCIFRRIGAGVDCRRSGAVRIEASNVLFLGSAEEHGAAPPWVVLRRLPPSGQSLRLRFRRVTFRESGPVLEAGQGDGLPLASLGEITIDAEACVFAVHRRAALLSLGAAVSPDVLAGRLRWIGAGSLLPLRGVVAQCLTADGREESLDDTVLSIAGLVRGRMEFAGPVGGDLDAHRVQDWQAPIASPDPPGATPDALPRRFPDPSP